MEALLAVALFAMLVTALASAVLYGQQVTAMAGNRVQAALLVDEGMVAVESMRDINYAGLSDGVYGLSRTEGQWVLVTEPDVTGIFTRTLSLTDIGPGTKRLTVQVTWEQSAVRSGEVLAETQLSDW